METIIRWTIILTLAFVGIGFTHEVFKKHRPEIVEVEDSPLVRSKNKTFRSPASVLPTLNNKMVSSPDPRVTESTVDRSAFNQNIDSSLASKPSDHSDSSEINSNPKSYFENNGKNYRANDDSTQAPKPDSASKNSKSIAQSKNGTVMNGPGIFLSNVGKTPVGISDSGTSVEDTSSTSQGDDRLSCYASVGGGAFGNPIQVGLTCSAAADIKYCLQEGSCCDPVSSGVNYTGPVVIGAADGNFCLSYYGESTNSKTSYVYEQSYAISNTYPDIQINFPKVFYQTTQLSGYNLLRSNDFSKPDFWIGEINLKTHDPGPAALNLSCQDIVEDFLIFPAPSAVKIFDPMDMAFIGSGSQLNVPLVLAKLDYGENFITSYVVNNNHAAPLYSCSTNKVTLKDFDYFLPEVSHGDVGTNFGREFSGSFVAYSFFEPEPVVFRTPAGSANEDNSGQELRVGSFAVFY